MNRDWNAREVLERFVRVHAQCSVTFPGKLVSLSDVFASFSHGRRLVERLRSLPNLSASNQRYIRFLRDVASVGKHTPNGQCAFQLVVSQFARTWRRRPRRRLGTFKARFSRAALGTAFSRRGVAATDTTFSFACCLFGLHLDTVAVSGPHQRNCSQMGLC